MREFSVNGMTIYINEKNGGFLSNRYELESGAQTKIKDPSSYNDCLGDLSSGFDSAIAKEIYKTFVSRKDCSQCPFRFACGGECKAEGNKPNEAMRRYNKGLILLSMRLEEDARLYPEQYDEIIHFCLEKISKTKEDSNLRMCSNEHPNLAFTATKKLFDGGCTACERQ